VIGERRKYKGEESKCYRWVEKYGWAHGPDPNKTTLF